MKKFSNKIYLNYAGFGPISKELYLKLTKFIQDYYVFGPPDVIRKYKFCIDKLREEVALLIKCDKQEVACINNTTEGIIFASESIPLKKNDEILIMGGEYGANYVPWLKKKNDGFRVNIISGKDNEESFNKLLAAINRNTRIISVSWVQYYDGYVVDLHKLSKICKKNNIFLIVDAIQGIGTRELDLKKTNIDMMICGGHKQLMSILGSGFLYVNKKLISRLKHYKVGPRSVIKFNKDGYVLKNNSERFEDGTPNLFGVLSLYHSIRKINKIGIKNIEKRNINILKKFKQILKLNNISFIDYEKQGNIISLKVKNPDKICKILENQNIYTKVIKDVLRISFNYKSTEIELRQMIKKMNRLCNRFI